MKHTRYRIAFLALLLGSLLSACQDRTVQIYEANVPQVQSWEAFRSSSFAMEAARPLKQPGKIYIYENLLLVNEFLVGMHFFDNSNPANPVAIGFLPIHANMDMAVRNDILYVDSYTDLLAFDISDPGHPQFQSRLNDAFRFTDVWLIPGYDDAYPMVSFTGNEGVVIGWEIQKVTEEARGHRDWFTTDTEMAFNTSSGSTFIGGTGKAGSTARFSIIGDHLYSIHSVELKAISLLPEPQLVRTINIARNGESLFPFDDYLFIGTTTGMLIYQISDPGNPTYLSEYNHVNSCDPVVVEGNRAYVTLHSGNLCQETSDLLEVIDISNISNPVLLHSFPMANPRGLGVDGSLLFLCDGPEGLKVFDRTADDAIPQNVVGHFPGIESNDVIPYNQVLIMTSTQGIFQYSYADPGNVVQLSLIPIQP